jgi:outer membrane lipoprotein SlyB
MKRSLSIFLLALLIIGTLAFAAEPISSAQTVTRTTVVRTRHRRHRRTFWQKHRDKLTVAGSTVAGAGIGAIAGGKKGAAIGSLVGAGSGAVYTYKIRKRHRHYRRY